MNEYGWMSPEEQRRYYTVYDREDVEFLCRALKSWYESMQAIGFNMGSIKIMEETAERLKNRHEEE